MVIKNLNLELEEEVIQRAKIKSEILGLTLKDYITRLIEVNCENIPKTKLDDMDKELLKK